ncbi:MAG: hypothetical protein ACLQBQ_05910 [Smithella sp.]
MTIEPFWLILIFLFDIAKLNLKIIEVPVRYRERTMEQPISAVEAWLVINKDGIFCFKKN